MKKLLLYLILLFYSCLSSETNEYKNIISKDVMKNILKDIILMESIKKSYSSRIDDKKIFGDKYIFEKLPEQFQKLFLGKVTNFFLGILMQKEIGDMQRIMLE